SACGGDHAARRAVWSGKGEGSWFRYAGAAGRRGVAGGAESGREARCIAGQVGACHQGVAAPRASKTDRRSVACGGRTIQRVVERAGGEGGVQRVSGTSQAGFFE